MNDGIFIVGLIDYVYDNVHDKVFKICCEYLRLVASIGAEIILRMMKMKSRGQGSARGYYELLFAYER